MSTLSPVVAAGMWPPSRGINSTTSDPPCWVVVGPPQHVAVAGVEVHIEVDVAVLLVADGGDEAARSVAAVLYRQPGRVVDAVQDTTRRRAARRRAAALGAVVVPVPAAIAARRR
jgi:hypothetical protein